MAALDAWKEIALAPGETRRHCMVVGSETPELHRIRLSVGDGARAELFVVIAGDDYNRVEIEVELGAGAHFEFGGVTIGGGDAVQRDSSPARATTPLAATSKPGGARGALGPARAAISSARIDMPGAAGSRPMRRRISRR